MHMAGLCMVLILEDLTLSVACKHCCSAMCFVQTWGNRADALVRQAELLAEVTPAQSGDDAVGQAFEQAMQAYEKACSMTSSEQGDDLPGLLHNWGVGLRSMADLQKVLSLSQT
jgi:hypothetical protein